MFARQMGSTLHQFHKMIYRSLAASILLFLYDVILLLSLLLLHNCHPHWNDVRIKLVIVKLKRENRNKEDKREAEWGKEKGKSN